MLVEPRWRLGLSATAVLVGVVSPLIDPGGPGELAALAAAVLLVVGFLWLPQVPSPLSAAVAFVPLVLAVRHGQLEQGLFLTPIVAVAAAWFETAPARAYTVGVLALATPAVSWALLPPQENFLVLSWELGIAFGWVAGRFARQQQRLVAAQRELAARTVVEERRRIARDVHDLVGHGLAAVLLHLTGARHVLRRDLDAADEALAEAEAAGRIAMGELRRTMALLRTDGESGLDAPVPGLDRVAELVRAAADRGFRVTYAATGDLSAPGAGVAVAAHRIAQEALANAQRHAPAADTAVALSVDDDAVRLEVTTVGPLAPAGDPDRPRYGLVGMRERAEIVGGTLEAGATDQGWQVRARLPRGGSA